MRQLVKIFNGSIILQDKVLHGGAIVVSGTTIVGVHETDLPIADAIEIDAQGHYISPGFIDLHVHGGGGYDFMDGHEAAFLNIAETHARHGTTAMLPTTLTSTKAAIIETLEIYQDAHRNNHHGSQFLGMHLEGPYFAMNQRGAQDAKYIRSPDPGEYLDILRYAGAIRRWSIAPELEGALELGRCLRDKNILPSMAHTDATYEEVLPAFENGFSLATHLYSGMSGVTRKNAFRYAGAVESAFIIDGMDVEIIADGVHLPAPLLKLVYKVKGAQRTALVTDAIRAAGTDVSESVLGNMQHGLRVIVEDGVAKLPDRSSFAGSVATADRLVRTMIELAELSLPETIRMISATPARILGLSASKGELSAGRDADIVVFDDKIRVRLTMIGGKIIYRDPKFN